MKNRFRPNVEVLEARDVPTLLTWHGGVGLSPHDWGNWNNYQNWLPAAVPTAADDVLIPSSAQYYPSIYPGMDDSCRNLTMTSTSSQVVFLHIQGSLTVWGSSYLDWTSDSTTGRIYIDGTDGAKLTIAGSGRMIYGAPDFGDPAAFNTTITVQDSGKLGLVNRFTKLCSTLNVSGGENGGYVWLADTLVGNIDVEKTINVNVGGNFQANASGNNAGSYGGLITTVGSNGTSNGRIVVSGGTLYRPGGAWTQSPNGVYNDNYVSFALPVTLNLNSEFQIDRGGNIHVEPGGGSDTFAVYDNGGKIDIYPECMLYCNPKNLYIHAGGMFVHALPAGPNALVQAPAYTGYVKVDGGSMILMYEQGVYARLRCQGTYVQSGGYLDVNLDATNMGTGNYIDAGNNVVTITGSPHLFIAIQNGSWSNTSAGWFWQVIYGNASSSGSFVLSPQNGSNFTESWVNGIFYLYWAPSPG